MKKLPYAIAVDFDGCICKSEFPDIGPPNMKLIRRIIRLRKHGCKIVLWTCREGERLNDALKFCKYYDLEFDSINESLPERIEMYGEDCRKIGVDEYFDDRAIRVKYGSIRLFDWFTDLLRIRKIKRSLT